jgi:hypothetical protein
MDENTKPQDDGVKTDGTAMPAEGDAGVETPATPTEGGEAAAE